MGMSGGHGSLSSHRGASQLPLQTSLDNALVLHHLHIKLVSQRSKKLKGDRARKNIYKLCK
jgi:hypothetical protein